MYAIYMASYIYNIYFKWTYYTNNMCIVSIFYHLYNMLHEYNIFYIQVPIYSIYIYCIIKCLNSILENKNLDRY